MISELYLKIQEKEAQNPELKFKVKCSYLHIYLEKIFDLLDPRNNGIDLRKKPTLGGDNSLKIRLVSYDTFGVEDLIEATCKTEQQLMSLFIQGAKNRVTDGHSLNQTSSRSHALFQINLEQFDVKYPVSPSFLTPSAPSPPAFSTWSTWPALNASPPPTTTPTATSKRKPSKSTSLSSLSNKSYKICQIIHPEGKIGSSTSPIASPSSPRC